MSQNSRRLGRGLKSLLGPTTDDSPSENGPGAHRGSDIGGGQQVGHRIVVESPPSQAQIGQIVPAPGDDRLAWAAAQVAVEDIRPRPDQPRRTFDADSIAGLARSIAQSGIVQPLVVRRRDGEDTGYELVAGERRWRAAKAAGLSKVPVIIRVTNDREAAEIGLIENIHREDLNAVDRAEAYRAYCESNGVNAEGLAAALGEDRSTVANYLRMLELSDAVKEWVRQNKLGMAHARCLLGIDSVAAQDKLARDVVEKGLSVRAVEQAVREWKANRRGNSVGATQAGKSQTGKRPQVAHLEEKFQQALGTKVSIKEGRKRGTGKITIEYYSLDDFDRIADSLGVGE